MKRKIILLWLCMMMALLPLAAGTAEGTTQETVPADQTVSDVWVMYVPDAETGSLQQLTSIYIAKAIRARQDKTTVHWYRTVASGESRENDVFDANNNFFKPSTSTGHDGNGKIQLKNIDRIIPSADAHDLYLIVPASAAENVARNQDWADYFRQLLGGNPATKLHVLFVGKEPVRLEKPATPEIGPETENEPGNESGQAREASELERMAAEYRGRVDWVNIQEDFERTKTEDHDILTLDYFIASLFGASPIDLEIGDGNTITIPGEETQNVFILARAPESADFIVKDGYDNVLRPGFSTKGIGKLGTKYVYSGLSLSGGNGSTYTIEAGDSAENAPTLKAYRYPDLTRVAPAFVLGDGQLKFGPNEISIQVADDLGRNADFIAQFTVFINGTDEMSIPKDQIIWNEAAKKWTYTLEVQKGTDSITVVPSLKLISGDNNLAKEWTGWPQVIQVTSEGINKKDDSRTTADLYIYGEETMKLELSPAEFFRYNEKDPNLTFDVEQPDEMYGISALYNPESKKFEISIPETDIARAKQNHGLPVQVVLKGGELTQELTVNILDAEVLLDDWIELSMPEETEIKAGSPISATVSISRENYELYTKAVTEAAGGNVTIPSIDFPVTLSLTGEKETNITIEGTLAEIPEGGMRLQLDTAIPATAKNGSDLVLKVEAGSVKAAETSVTVINTPPGANNSLKDQETVSIEGIRLPVIGGNYEETDLLEALGLEEPYSLFTDDETDLRSVTLTITGTAGLKTQEIEKEAPAVPEETAEESGGETGEGTGEETEEKTGEETGKETAEEPAGTEEAETGTEEVPAETAVTAEAITEGNTWTFVLTKDQPRVPVKILVSDPAEYTITLTADDGANEPVKQAVQVKIVSRWLEIGKIAALALAGLLLALAVFLTIRQIRKPKFDNVKIRCLLWSEENQERAKEVLNKSKPVSMAHFGKKPATLSNALIMTRQTALTPELAEIADDITLLPTKHDELSIVFGKKAMAAIGRQEKKEFLAQGNSYRIRLGDQYLLIDNVQ